MSGADSIAAIRSVHDAAIGLTLACTEAVGGVAMAVALPTARVLGEPVPRPMRRALRAIDKGGKPG